MATISYPKSWTNGEVLTASELNGNFTAVTDAVNGSLADDNFGGSADVDPSNIGDYSDTVGEMQTMTDPGEVGTESQATDLRGEVARLRYQLDQIIGKAEWYEAPATTLELLNTSAGQFPSNGPNLVGHNAGFDADDDGGTGTPEGWTQKGTATYLTNATDAVQGSGLEVTVTDAGVGGNAEGITRTIAGLKGSQVYGIQGGTAPTTAGSSGRFRVTTGGGTDFSTTFDGTADGTSYTTKSGTFTTTAGGGDVVIDIDLDTSGDAVKVDNISIVELFSVKSADAGAIYEEAVTTSTQATGDRSASWADWTDLTGEVHVHSPGYRVRVQAYLFMERDTGNATGYAGRLMQQIDGGGYTAVTNAVVGMDPGQGGVSLASAWCIEHTLAAPVPGSKYEYKIEIGATGSTSASLNPTVSYAGTSIDFNSKLIIELIPW
ncbi:outer membrane autotransporter barrel domain protein [uncultured Mediterranean phage]|nr:outer membrane autotransporter barrel domain protein [uncultured Mediterranean phage]